MFRSSGAYGAVLAALAVLACGETTVIGPANQLEVANVADNFQLQVSNLDKASQTLQYTWVNTGVQANINQSSALTGGSATVTIKDNAGTQVFNSSVSPNGTTVSTAGTAGNWTIQLVLDKAAGTINFRVQKKT